jgi:aspartate-semialdehyde dehydrogenase
MAYKYPIHRNAIPQCDSFEANGYTKEEMKLVKETKKILSDNSIAVTATAVRVPIVGGHSEAVNIEFENDYELNDIRVILQQTDGVIVQDDLDAFSYPMPLFAQGKDAVFVGRIRRDESQANSLNMWIVSDNLRKGAALNAAQIAELVASDFATPHR